MPARVLGERRRLQQGLPAIFEVFVYHGFRAYSAAPVFFVPAGYKTIYDGYGGGGVGVRRFLGAKPRFSGRNGYDVHPMPAWRYFFGVYGYVSRYVYF